MCCLECVHAHCLWFSLNLHIAVPRSAVGTATPHGDLNFLVYQLGFTPAVILYVQPWPLLFSRQVLHILRSLQSPCWVHLSTTVDEELAMRRYFNLPLVIIVAIQYGIRIRIIVLFSGCHILERVMCKRLHKLFRAQYT